MLLATSIRIIEFFVAETKVKWYDVRTILNIKEIALIRFVFKVWSKSTDSQKGGETDSTFIFQYIYNITINLCNIFFVLFRINFLKRRFI